MNDTQFAQTIGYKSRVSWCRIKSGKFPVSEALMYRLAKQWPELRVFLLGDATQGSDTITQSNHQTPSNRNLRGFGGRLIISIKSMLSKD